ncbi:hypothetical protein EVAR_79253_1 [Eumeta japonica]|uniref:Uncharacterized protein n=1 Tax=Eumeta variegata TaxID=151549 RepID=A0A4C1TFI6_EUMVA|nr:hypothetical protein EVAR_79253_1 [Eumeta japonica]
MRDVIRVSSLGDGGSYHTLTLRGRAPAGGGVRRACSAAADPRPDKTAVSLGAHARVGLMPIGAGARVDVQCRNRLKFVSRGLVHGSYSVRLDVRLDNITYEGLCVRMLEEVPPHDAGTKFMVTEI